MPVQHPEIADFAQLQASEREGRARVTCDAATAHAFMVTPMVGPLERKRYYRRLLGWYASWPLAGALGLMVPQTLGLPLALGALGGGWWLRGQARAMAGAAAVAAALSDEAAFNLLNVDGGMRVEVVRQAEARGAEPGAGSETRTP